MFAHYNVWPATFFLFITFYISNHTWFGQMINIKLSSSSYRYFLTVVRSESMKPALQIGDILVTYNIPLDLSNGRQARKPLLAKGEIVIMEVSIESFVCDEKSF